MGRLSDEILLRSVKIIDIGYVTAIYFLLGIVSARAFDNFYGKYNEEKEKNKTMFQQTMEIIGMMWLYGVIIYIVKNLVELIPSPFNGLFGFNHFQLKELKNAAVYTFIFLYFQSYFKAKITGYYNRLVIKLDRPAPK